MSSEPIDRYCPDQPFPAYAYVPGRTPHPQRDADGHGVQLEPARIVAVDPGAWRTSAAYCYGVDLFNAGYPWEAHEAWEDLWRAYPQGAAAAAVLAGLIKLAAAGVKARTGNAAGVARTLAKGERIFAELGPRPSFGIAPDAVRAAIARTVAETAAAEGRLPFVLVPGDAETGGVSFVRPPRG